MLEIGSRIEVSGVSGIIDEVILESFPPSLVGWRDPYGVKHVIEGQKSLPDMWLKVRVDRVFKRAEETGT